MTWDSADDNIVHPQESSTLSINVPTALPYPIAGVLAADLFCTGAATGTTDVTVASGSVSNTFPITVASVTSLRLDLDIANGNGPCDPIDTTVSANLGQGAVKVAVCLVNPTGTQNVAAFGYNVTYNDTILAAPEIADESPALDDNPDANDGTTTFTSATFPNDLGGNWACDGGVGVYPQGDNNPLTGAGNGNAYSGGCGSGAGPYSLISGPLGVITFDAITSGSDTIAFGASAVTGEDLSEIGSCNQDGDVPIDCIGGTVTIGGNCLLQAPNSDGEVRPNGPNVPDDDATWPEHDLTGDLCDNDDDNDGLPDLAELTGVMCNNQISLPNDIDTDGDHLHDGWECANGSDPFDAESRFLGVSTGDADGDHLHDVWEVRGYNGSGGSADSDGDGCTDLIEIVSTDGNRTLDDGDRLSTSRRALGILAANVEQDYVLDLNKNGVVDDSDRLLAARAVLLPDWLPKSCP
jgi:hypothetical protein